jgi:hypothetical protein
MPTLIPFFFHWYKGVNPPFTGVAKNVISDPEHIEVMGVYTLTEVVALGFTVTVKEQLVSGEEAREYVTVVVPALNKRPLALPFPFPVVAPVNVYV